MNKEHSQAVAERIIEMLEQGTAPWQKPWAPGELSLPYNPTTGKSYRGINSMWLSMQGYSDPRWMTYKQAGEAGAQVRRGSKGTRVEFWKFADELPVTDAAGNPVFDSKGVALKRRVELERPRVFYATVFNGEQIDGLPPLEPRATVAEPLRHARAELILANSGAKIHHEAGDRAYYRPATDSITLPERDQFATPDGYYATALHELGHWTGHPSRLDRDLAHPFGSEGYAREELRAEIASLMLGERLEIGHDPGQHAAYVGSWIKALKQDHREIFRAASDAERISTFVMAFEQELSVAQEAARATPVPAVIAAPALPPAPESIQATIGETRADGWLHHTTVKALESIAATGLQPADTTGKFNWRIGVERAIYGTDGGPIYLAQADAQRGKLVAMGNGPSNVTLSVDVSDFVLLADMPTLGHDYGIKITDGDDGPPRAILNSAISRDLFHDIAVNNVIPYADLVNPDSAFTKRAIAVTGTAAVTTPIPIDRLSHEGVQLSPAIATNLLARPLDDQHSFSPDFLRSRERGSLPSETYMSAISERYGPGGDDEYAFPPEFVSEDGEEFRVDFTARELHSLASGDLAELDRFEGARRSAAIKTARKGLDQAGLPFTYFDAALEAAGAAEPATPVVNQDAAAIVRPSGNFIHDAADAAEAIAMATAHRGLAARTELTDLTRGIEIPEDPLYRITVWDAEERRNRLLVAFESPAEALDAFVQMVEGHRQDLYDPGIAELDRRPAPTLTVDELNEDGVYRPLADTVMVDGSLSAWADPRLILAAQKQAAQDDPEYVLRRTEKEGPNPERHLWADLAEMYALASTLPAPLTSSTVERLHEEQRVRGQRNVMEHIRNGHFDRAVDDCTPLVTWEWIKAISPDLGLVPTVTLNEERGIDGKPYRVSYTRADGTPTAIESQFSDDGKMATFFNGDQLSFISSNDFQAQAITLSIADDRDQAATLQKALEARAAATAEAAPADREAAAAPELHHEPEPGQMTTSRTYLAVPFREKNKAKAAGARWDKDAKQWFAPEGVDLERSGLKQWLPEERTVVSVAEPETPEVAFKKAMELYGLEPEGAPVMNGELQRCRVKGDTGAEKSGAYTGYKDGIIPAGFIQNFKTGQKENWKHQGKLDHLSAEERAKLEREGIERAKERNDKIAAGHDRVSKIATAFYAEAPRATAKNAYCAKKGIAHPGELGLRVVPTSVSPELAKAGVRIARDPRAAKAMRDKEPDAKVFIAGDLLIPGMDSDGKIWTLQSVNPNFKGFIKGSRKSGVYTIAGMKPEHYAPGMAKNPDAPVIVAEGYATGQRVARLANVPVVIAFDSGNLSVVARELQQQYPGRPILFAADNDHQAPLKLGPDGKPLPNVGLVKATDAAAELGGGVFAPPFAPDQKGTDWDDFARLHGDDAAQKVLQDEMERARVDAVMACERLSSLARDREMDARDDPTTTADDAYIASERAAAHGLMAQAVTGSAEVRAHAREAIVAGGSPNRAAAAAAVRDVAALQNVEREQRGVVLQNSGTHEVEKPALAAARPGRRGSDQGVSM